MRVVATLVLVVGCSKASSDGLPPATEWQSNDPVAAAGEMPSRPRGVPSGDPHAGAMGGGDVQSDPHAGVPGAPPLSADQLAGGDPHAGVPGAPPIANPNTPHDTPAAMDVTKLGLSSPDPNRPIDPSRHIKGVLKLDAKLKDKAKPGDAVFLMVRKPNADGQPTGAPIAVDRVTWSGGDTVAFELTEKHAMVAGAPDLVGDLIMMARIDHDQDAMTRQPGDVTGMAKVKIPADGVVVSLDTLLQ